MKILNIAFFALLISFVGCTKKEEVTLAKNDAVSVGKLQSELIIGSWQLTSIGTISQIATSGCGNNGSTHDVIIWKSTPIIDNMSFKSSGDFSKNSGNDAVCSGTYKVSSGAIVTKTSCSVDEQKQAINTIDASTMVIEGDNMFYLYDKK
jgi:hypothetical protein